MFHLSILIQKGVKMEAVNLKSVIKESLTQGISYSEYSDLIQQMVDEEKTTGPKQHEDLVYYTKLNAQRARRLNKTTKLPENVASLIAQFDQPMTWLVLTESWCGDAAQILPLLQKMVEVNSNINLRLVLRDENDTLMSQFLTNGGRSIPKLIMLNDELDVLGTWGPRPVEAQELYDSWRNDPNKPPYKEFQVEMQKWYLKDKGQSTFNEISKVLEDIQLVEA